MTNCTCSCTHIRTRAPLQHTYTHITGWTPRGLEIPCEFTPLHPFSGDFVISNVTYSAVVFYYCWISTAHPLRHQLPLVFFPHGQSLLLCSLCSYTVFFPLSAFVPLSLKGVVVGGSWRFSEDTRLLMLDLWNLSFLCLVQTHIHPHRQNSTLILFGHIYCRALTAVVLQQQSILW